ncbi:hypothetical protein PF003_g18360 [Phytophthora fragariae]|nr:hypothetical protein PF003_g18360 [Phytophthora fragariae]
MKGDVKAAYKNIHVHEEVSAFFAGSIPEDDVVVIDLALPFGWTGSAAHYGAFGKAISHLVRRESPNSLNPSDPDTEPFFCFNWVDDHVLVEHDIGDRLQACDSAILLAMTAVLGPRAINEKKFTDWSTRLIALGLEWDSVAMTVSMPQAKIQKALGRVQGILNSRTTTRTQLSKLLGSLRHVCSCIRPAKPFFQRLVGLWKRAPRAQPVRVSQEARLDLVWFDHILRHGRLTGVSLEYFCDLPAPDVHLFMDASDTGLCVLNPAQQEYLRIQFDATEKDMIKRQEFSINVREQFSALLAVLCLGGRWNRTSRPRPLLD